MAGKISIGKNSVRNMTESGSFSEFFNDLFKK